MEKSASAFGIFKFVQSIASAMYVERLVLICIFNLFLLQSLLLLALHRGALAAADRGNLRRARHRRLCLGGAGQQVVIPAHFITVLSSHYRKKQLLLNRK